MSCEAVPGPAIHTRPAIDGKIGNYHAERTFQGDKRVVVVGVGVIRVSWMRVDLRTHDLAVREAELVHLMQRRPVHVHE